jgi:hypothetical protein
LYSLKTREIPTATTLRLHRVLWKKDKIVGQKAPLKLRDI